MRLANARASRPSTYLTWVIDRIPLHSTDVSKCLLSHYQWLYFSNIGLVHICPHFIFGFRYLKYKCRLVLFIKLTLTSSTNVSIIIYKFCCENLFNTTLSKSNDNNNNRCYQPKESVKSQKIKMNLSLIIKLILQFTFACLFVFSTLRGFSYLLRYIFFRIA